MSKDIQTKKNLSTYTAYTSFFEHFLSLGDLGKNLIDRCAYEEVHDREREVVRYLKELAGLGRGGKGITTSGSSEAIILGLSYHLHRHRRLKGKKGRENFVVSKLNHNVFEKFSMLFDVELRAVAVRSDGTIDTSRIEERVDSDTFCLVAIAGTTETCGVDDIEAIADIGQRLGLAVHVDAAIGGFILPFAHEGPRWNFEHCKIDSMNISLSKYGNAVPGLGILLLRDEELIPKQYSYEMSYISGGKTGDLGLLCSRNSYPVSNFYRHMKRNRSGGYRRYIEGRIAAAKELRQALKNLGFSVINTLIPVVVFRHQDEQKMEALVIRLRQSGYILSYAPIAALGTCYARIVVKSNVSKTVARYLLRVAKEIVNEGLETGNQFATGKLNLSSLRVIFF